MANSFDPYHKWLGIAPDEQPPNHYRLLGIDPKETDPDVISNAADKQMAFVRAFQVGKHSAEASRILNEISRARLSLLRSEEKDRRDSALWNADVLGLDEVPEEPPDDEWITGVQEACQAANSDCESPAEFREADNQRACEECAVSPPPPSNTAESPNERQETARETARSERLVRPPPLPKTAEKPQVSAPQSKQSADQSPAEIPPLPIRPASQPPPLPISGVGSPASSPWSNALPGRPRRSSMVGKGEPPPCPTESSECSRVHLAATKDSASPRGETAGHTPTQHRVSDRMGQANNQPSDSGVSWIVASAVFTGVVLGFVILTVFLLWTM